MDTHSMPLPRVPVSVDDTVTGTSREWDVQRMSQDTHSMPLLHVSVSVDGTVTGTSRECPWTPTHDGTATGTSRECPWTPSYVSTSCLSIRGWHSNWDVQGMSMDTTYVSTHVSVSVDGTITGRSRNVHGHPPIPLLHAQYRWWQLLGRPGNAHGYPLHDGTATRMSECPWTPT